MCRSWACLSAVKTDCVASRGKAPALHYLINLGNKTKMALFPALQEFKLARVRDIPSSIESSYSAEVHGASDNK